MDSPVRCSRFSLVIACKVPAVYLRQPVSRLLPPPSSPLRNRTFVLSICESGEALFFKKNGLFIYWRCEVLAAAWAFPSCYQKGELLEASGGYSGRGARLLTAAASLVAEHGLWGLWGSPPARDRPCIARRILNHWTTREAEHLVLLL